MEQIIFNVSLYIGIAGLLMFLISFITGLKLLKIQPKYKLHKRIGIIGFIAVTIHGVVMAYFYFLT